MAYIHTETAGSARSPQTEKNKVLACSFPALGYNKKIIRQFLVLSHNSLLQLQLNQSIYLNCDCLVLRIPSRGSLFSSGNIICRCLFTLPL